MSAEVSTKIAALEEKVAQLSQQLTESQRAAELRALLMSAAQAGKTVPLSDAELAALPLEAVRKLIDNLPATTKPAQASPPEPPTPTSPIEALSAAVRALRDKLQCSAAAALRKVIQEQPEIYRAYLDSGAGNLKLC